MTEHNIVPQAEEHLPLTTYGVSYLLGIPEVTEKSWRKVYTRLQVAVQLGLLQENPEDRFTPELVRRHIGHEIGAYNLSDAAWRTHVMKMAEKKHVDFLDAWTTAQ